MSDLEPYETARTPMLLAGRPRSEHVVYMRRTDWLLADEISQLLPTDHPGRAVLAWFRHNTALRDDISIMCDQYDLGWYTSRAHGESFERIRARFARQRVDWALRHGLTLEAQRRAQWLEEVATIPTQREWAQHVVNLGRPPATTKHIATSNPPREYLAEKPRPTNLSVKHTPSVSHSFLREKFLALAPHPQHAA